VEAAPSTDVEDPASTDVEDPASTDAEDHPWADAEATAKEAAEAAHPAEEVHHLDTLAVVVHHPAEEAAHPATLAVEVHHLDVTPREAAPASTDAEDPAVAEEGHPWADVEDPADHPADTPAVEDHLAVEAAPSTEDRPETA